MFKIKKDKQNWAVLNCFPYRELFCLTNRNGQIVPGFIPMWMNGWSKMINKFSDK